MNSSFIKVEQKELGLSSKLENIKVSLKLMLII